MLPVTSTIVLRPVATLLGGTGCARASNVQCRPLPALLRPPVATVQPSG